LGKERFKKKRINLAFRKRGGKRPITQHEKQKTRGLRWGGGKKKTEIKRGAEAEKGKGGF